MGTFMVLIKYALGNKLDLHHMLFVQPSLRTVWPLEVIIHYINQTASDYFRDIRKALDLDLRCTGRFTRIAKHSGSIRARTIPFSSRFVDTEDRSFFFIG